MSEEVTQLKMGHSVQEQKDLETIQANHVMINTPTVAICVATFRNNEGLDRLLESFAKIQFSKVPWPKLQLFVVDNDARGLAQEVIRKWQQRLQFPIHYEVEERRGIPFVRNRLVEMASALDFIVFIDDDEAATPQWLDELLYVQKEFSASVVTGPVLPRFEVEPPEWAVAGEFYQSTRQPTGSGRQAFYTNNVLLKTNLLSTISKPFEERMALSGGTDRLLALQLRQKHGVDFVWADNAVVYEYVPAQRLTMRWYFRRRYRIGNSRVLGERYLPRDHYKVRSILIGCRMIGLGVAVVVSSVWRGRHKVIRGIGYMCTGGGMIVGALGLFQKEYARDDYRRT